MQNVMGRFIPKMLVRTSYGTGPYKIIDVTENCECPSFSDYITLLDKAPHSRKHVHIRCRDLVNRYSNYYLNGYDENGLSVWDENNRLIVCAEETLLLTLFL